MLEEYATTELNNVTTFIQLLAKNYLANTYHTWNHGFQVA